MHRGKIHDYVGMTLDFLKNKEVKITMIDYVDRMLDEAPEEFQSLASSSSSKHPFMIDCNTLQARGGPRDEILSHSPKGPILMQACQSRCASKGGVPEYPGKEPH